MKIEVEGKTKNFEIEGEVKDGKILIKIKPESELGESCMTNVFLVSVLEAIGHALEEAVGTTVKQEKPLSDKGNMTLKSRLDLPLSQHIISGRVKQAINALGIVFVGELVQKEAADLKKVKYAGPATVRDIINFLHTIGLRLGMDVEKDLHGWQPPQKEE